MKSSSSFSNPKTWLLTLFFLLPLFSFRVSEETDFEGATEVCNDETDSECSFATAAEGAELALALEEAGVVPPEGVCRVDALLRPDAPEQWETAAGEDATETIEGFTPAECNFEELGEDEEFMTCGLDLSTRTFSCITPSVELPALLVGLSLIHI